MVIIIHLIGRENKNSSQPKRSLLEYNIYPQPTTFNCLGSNLDMVAAARKTFYANPLLGETVLSSRLRG
jgi:hypothetical protein